MNDEVKFENFRYWLGEEREKRRCGDRGAEERETQTGERDAEWELGFRIFKVFLLKN